MRCAMYAEVVAMSQNDRNDAYKSTLDRMEPVAMVDRDAALASIAVSLKRIADAVEKTSLEDFRFVLYNGITEGIIAARPR